MMKILSDVLTGLMLLLFVLLAAWGCLAVLDHIAALLP